MHNDDKTYSEDELYSDIACLWADSGNLSINNEEVKKLISDKVRRELLYDEALKSLKSSKE
ncbi:hypothetical protein M9Y10_018780 [Tritrichomonas musculus]|uniref:Uncharacterized protein n=1 Tax=Tritrichomonas musculus TaxID=1915356 RepID=A0ABR2HHQ7_9EUKA